MSNIFRSIATLATVVLIVLSASCSRQRSLSDQELAEVFRDAFISNAYSSSKALKLDSLRLYEPIFERYGYTVEDVQYTIGNFSMRKSARLSDVVERAIAMLEEEGKRLDGEVAILDSINVIAQRHSTEILYRDSLLEFRALRDSSKMMIVLEDVKAGQYTIHFDYLIDSLNTTIQNYKSRCWSEEDIVDQEGGEDVETEIKTVNKHTTILRKNNVSHLTNKVNLSTPVDRLVYIVAEIEPEKIKKRVNYSATFKDIYIEYVPSVNDALDLIYKELLNVNIFDNDLFSPIPKDSL